MALDKFLNKDTVKVDKGKAVEAWVDKHKPKNTQEICGQGKAVNEALEFVENWKKGKALFLHGAPGVGKTVLVEALALEKGLSLQRLNASDKRTKATIENFIQTARSHSLSGKGKIILVDEADGISGRSDRGGVNAIVTLIKQSSYPVFIAANDPWSQKLRPLRNYCKLVKLGKVPSPSISKRLKEICQAEGVEFEEDAIKNLARWCNGDLRSAINDLQMVTPDKKLDSKDLEVLGYRERLASIFDSMNAIMRAGSLQAVRKAIYSSDKDPDEIFLWIESNAANEYPGEIAEVYDLLSKADIMRKRVMVQQNWRFKAFMVDLMAGASVLGKPGHGYVKYSHPDKIIKMGRSKFERAKLKGACKTLGAELHCSSRKVKHEYLPWIKVMLEHSDLGLEKETLEALV